MDVVDSATPEFSQGAIISVDPQAALVDRRMLIFRTRTLCAAIEQVGRGRIALPRPEVSDAEMLPGDQAVRFVFGRGDLAERRSVSGAELAALLIGYCLAAKIPIPNKATKTVSVTTSGVLLDFVMTFAQPPVAQPAQTRAPGWSGVERRRS